MNLLRTSTLPLALYCLLGACGPRGKGSLCERTFEPYMDLISGQARTVHNDLYLDGMKHYAAGEFAEAITDLQQYVERKGSKKSAYIYLACSQLAVGRPYDAELSIDHLENSNETGFADQCEWYTVVCWLCSDQQARALSGAQAIAARPRHTYGEQARALVDALNKEGTE